MATLRKNLAQWEQELTAAKQRLEALTSPKRLEEKTPTGTPTEDMQRIACVVSGGQACRGRGRGAEAWRTGAAAPVATEQEQELGKVLMANALSAGFPTELWTLPRIGKLIHDRFGVEYSTGHLWHLLRRMGFSCQKPEKRALQRNEEEIARWKRYGWPALKKKPSEKAEPSSSSTNPD